VKLINFINELKNRKSSTKNASHCFEEFIINEIGKRNISASNLILYITKSNSDNNADKISQDHNVLNNLIHSIISGDKIVKPTKLLRLGIRGRDKPRLIKAIFSSSADFFEILKSKKKLFSLNLSSNIGISSDRNLHEKTS
jgi:hypothetical protein